MIFAAHRPRARAGYRRPGLRGRRRRQPQRADHPPRQVQVAQSNRQAAAQAPPSHRAADRLQRGRSPHDALGDAMHMLCCAAGYIIRWMLRANARLCLGGLFYALAAAIACVVATLQAMLVDQRALGSAAEPRRGALQGSDSSSLAMAVWISQGRLLGRRYHLISKTARSAKASAFSTLTSRGFTSMPRPGVATKSAISLRLS